VSQVLLSNGPLISSNVSYQQLIASDIFYQTPFQLTSSVQITGIVMFPRQNNISLTVRAALYDAASMLIAQTEIMTASAFEFSDEQPKPWTLPFDQPVNLAPGISYHVAYWYAGSSSGATNYVSLFATTPANATYLVPVAKFVTVNGSFPNFLAAPHTFLSGRSAPFIQFIGSRCTNTVPATIIHLNETILSILQGVRNKYGDIPAIGISIIQTPTLQSYAGAQSPANIVCPFIPVSTIVSGVRRIDSITPEPVTVDDKWHIGSNTKSMTAILILMLIQAGKLNLTTTVGDVFSYLPFSSISTASLTSCTCADFSNVVGYFAKSSYSCGLAIHTSWKYITVAHLLTHTSGLEVLNTVYLPEDYAFEVGLERNGTNESCSDYPLPSRRYHLSKILSTTIPNPPLSINVPANYSYVNHNYILLGLILEEIWHLPWESIIQQELFDHLGMITTGFGSPIKQVPFNSFANQPFGHYKDAAGVLRSTDEDLAKSWAPAGTVHSSLKDWAKFIACHLQEGHQLMSRDLVSMNSNFLNATTPPYLFSPFMWETIHTQYVFSSSSTSNSQHSLSGMVSITDNLGLLLTHSGTNTLWFTDVVAYPRLTQPVAFLIAMNVVNGNAVLEAKAAIMNAYLEWQQQGQPFPISTATGASYPTFSYGLACILTFIQVIY
jgi:CubicO group peptidase (beta-lactamase class C family)